MAFEHACFISFSRGTGKDSQFADEFFDEFSEQLAAINKNLSVFKFDRCEERRRGDAWDLWIKRELCRSAMMVAVCAPNYFIGSPGCVAEFKGMEDLIDRRTAALGAKEIDKWLIALRLKDRIPMPDLKSYRVRDFFDCCASPKRVRTVHKNRQVVEELAGLVYEHWMWLHRDGRAQKLQEANICRSFTLPECPLGRPNEYPHGIGVK
jgi:hypothetical protein